MSQHGMGRHTTALLDLPGGDVEQEMTQLRQRPGNRQFVSDSGHVAVRGMEPREPCTGQGCGCTRVQTGDCAGAVLMLVDIDLNGPRLHGVHSDPIGRVCWSILRRGSGGEPVVVPTFSLDQREVRGLVSSRPAVAQR